jgi:glycosyltransferase involved in cell wall biosynthesis
MQRQGIQRPVLWLSLPTAVDVVGRLDESATVYYCGDDFGALEGVDHAAVLAMERELADKAQLIVVSHPALAKKFPSEKIHLLPHGVDFDAFANATRVQTDAGDAPVAGFVGSIDSRLDIAALQAAVRRLPDWQFRFYGPIKTDISRLARYANVAFPGPLAAQDVAGYIKGWQVALLPYADSPMVRACNPLKLREYLAAGTPVAAIDMPALTEFRDVVEVAAPTQLADAIVAAARRNDTAARQARQSRVAQESWSQRAARVAELLHGLQVTR